MYKHAQYVNALKKEGRQCASGQVSSPTKAIDESSVMTKTSPVPRGGESTAKSLRWEQRFHLLSPTEESMARCSNALPLDVTREGKLCGFMTCALWPALSDGFLARVEANTIGTVGMQVAK